MVEWGLVSGIGEGTRAIKLGEVWRGGAPPPPELIGGQDKDGEELGQVRMAFDAMEAALDVQEGGGGRADRQRPAQGRHEAGKSRPSPAERRNLNDQ